MSDPSMGTERAGLGIFDAPAELGDASAAADAALRRPRWPGALAGALATLMVITWAVALASSLAGLLALGVGLSYSAIGLSVLAVLAGIVAVVADWGRGWGIAAVAVGVLLNPVVLLNLLTWIGAL